MTTATQELPLITRYLTGFEHELGALAPSERAEVVAEIRQHIADATAAGKPLDEVLQSLGPVEALARAYQLELLVSPRPNAPAQPRSDRWLRIAGLLAIGSLPTFIIVTMLGTIGIAFTVSGIAVALAGLIDQVGALPSWVTMDVPGWVAVAIGLFLTVLGILSSWATIAYLKFVVRFVRRVVPARVAAA